MRTNDLPRCLADCWSLKEKGRWLQEHNPTAYSPEESYTLTGANHELLTLDPVDRVAACKELLRRAKSAFSWAE